MSIKKKQDIFCEEFLVDMNATQAAIRAGYSAKTAYSIGQNLLKKIEIQKKISEFQALRSRRTEITADMVLKELASVGFSRITDFLRVGEECVEVPKEDPFDDSGEDDDDGLPLVSEKRYFKMVEIFETAKMPETAIPAIACIKQGMKGIEIKLHDKVKSLELIGRHLGMWNDKLDLTSKGESIKQPTIQLPDGTNLEI